MKTSYLFLLIPLQIACNKEKLFDGPNNYADDFSSYDNINELIENENENWSFFQKTYASNVLSIDTNIYHSAGKSFKSYAMPTAEAFGASKASINKQFMAFWANETVLIEAWYYIEDTASANWLFLFDLEEKTNIGAGPGMRLAMVNNQLRVEHKYPNPDILQLEGSEINVPRNQWVNIKMAVKLSQEKSGNVKVWQDDKLILHQDKWQTLPKDILYVLQGTKGMYSQIEFGVTANSSENAMTVYVDDIAISVID
ncbi:MAG: heparin lyase I family protein [Putridiphycobacter sp.]|nr:heparin lyase I family protein [Putridiphycobacter sp.]